MTEKPTYEELEKRDKELEKEPSKLKQAEKKARLMQYCVDNASDAVFWVDNKANFTYVNEAACRHMGYSREKLLSMKVHDVDPLYQKDNWPDFWREFKGKGSLLFESINRRKGGKEFPVEITVNYLEQDGTEIMHAYVRDISERKRAEKALQKAHDELEQRVQERTAELTDANERLKWEIDERKRAEGALRESEARYMAMFENMSNGVAVYKAVNDGEDFIFVGFNKAGEKIEKINKEDLIGKSVLDVFPGVKDFGLFEVFQRVWATGKSEYHPVAMYKDERISGWRENFVYRLPSGEIVALYSDETKRKQAEETAKLAYAELNQIFETAGGGMRVVDKDFNVLRINQTFATLSGKTEAQAVGRKCYEGFPGPACHTSQCPLSRILGGVERAEYEAEKERSDGTKVPCIITATPFKGPSGELIGIVQDFKDITERKQAEETLKEAHEKLEQRVRDRTAELVAANKELMRQVEARKEAEERVRGLSQQLIMAQEIERQRLSSDLHDNLAQDLSSLKIGLDTLFDNQPEASPETRQRGSELTNMLHGAIMAVRNLAYNLRPASLDQLGMIRTIREHCEEFSAENKVKVDFLPAGIDDLKLDVDTKITLYRLVQEGLNNVKKHADASHVTVRLVASFPNIILRIEDDGKGFDVQERLVATLNEKRMGLRSMEERVGLLQGKMRVESQPMQGTNIVIEVPYQRKENGE